MVTVIIKGKAVCVMAEKEYESLVETERKFNKCNIYYGINKSIDKALEYFAYACKQQLFWDGNKRTSTMIASKILIENGEGILTIGKSNAEEFNATLNRWYLMDELQPLKDCLKKCIKTLKIE